jgi:hypothetical protein
MLCATHQSGSVIGRAGYTSQIKCHAIELPVAVKPGRTRRRKLSKIAEVPERGQVSEELLEQIRNQVEYYFSYENLCKDEQLRRKVLGNVEGFGAMPIRVPGETTWSSPVLSFSLERACTHVHFGPC